MIYPAQTEQKNLVRTEVNLSNRSKTKKTTCPNCRKPLSNIRQVNYNKPRGKSNNNIYSLCDYFCSNPECPVTLVVIEKSMYELQKACQKCGRFYTPKYNKFICRACYKPVNGCRYTTKRGLS